MEEREWRGCGTVTEERDRDAGEERLTVGDIDRLIAGLTAREAEVFRYLRDGPSTRDLATRLAITERTVKHHVVNIRAKFGNVSRLQLCLLSATWSVASTDA